MWNSYHQMPRTYWLGSRATRFLVYFALRAGRPNHQRHNPFGCWFRDENCLQLSFVVFLEKCAPLVNSLNFGIASPLLLGLPPLQLALIKTPFALHQLTLLTSNKSSPSYTFLDQAALKVETAPPVFSSTGVFPGQGLKESNQCGLNLPAKMKGFGMNQPSVNQFAMNQSLINSSPFMGNPSGGMNLQGMSQRMDSRGMVGQTPPGYLPRFAGPLHNMGQPNLHPPGPPMIPHGDQQGDSRLSGDKMSLREAVHQLTMETKSIPNKWAVDVGSSGNSSAVMGMNPMPSSQVIEERRTLQSRYNTESATSILASFGLSNEDLEELSRYPDDQLTPENMPVILREIRLRKMNRQGPSVSAQSRGVGESVQSKVFDYGHSSKLGFNDEPVQTRLFNDPIDDQRRKDYRGMYTQGMDSHRSDNTEERFRTEKSMGHVGFQKEDINKQIFPITPTNKMGASSGQNSFSGTPPGLPIEVLNRKLLRDKNQSTPDHTSDLQMGTQQMSNMPSFQMANQPPNFSVGGPPTSYPLGNHPDLQPGGSPMNFPSHTDGSMRPPTMPPPAGPASYGKGNWSSRSPQPDPAKTKLLPTPSMMNDYYAASPRIFPHMCSLCNIECKHIKDWIQHQNTTTHIESCRQIRSKYPDWNPQALGALRNEANQDRSPRGRSGSGSNSPRHSRSSGPSHRLRRSRSPDKFTRPRSRSRSPRRAVRRSPRRSRSPRRISRASPRYRKTSSGERSSRKTSRTPGNIALSAFIFFFFFFFQLRFCPLLGMPVTLSSQNFFSKAKLSFGAWKGTHERIFADIIEAEESKPRPEIHDEFVHLKNLPKEGYTDLEVAYAGLRFGKVNNYVVIRNKRKAILHLDSAKNARAMYNFSLNYPCNLGNTTLKCTLSSKRKPLPGETVIAEDSDAGSEVENIDEVECTQMVSDGSAKTKLTDTNADHSSASGILSSSSNTESKNNAVQPTKNIQKGETEEKVVTLSSKPLVKPGGLKKKVLKKKSAIALEPFAKTLKFKRIALKPKVVKKTKPKGKGVDTVTDQVQSLEEACKTITEAPTPGLVTDKAGQDSQKSAHGALNGGINPTTEPKGTVSDGRKTIVKNGVETANSDKNSSEKIPPKASEKKANKDQTKVEVKNPSTTRSGVSKKGISSNQSSTVTAKQGGSTQKMTLTKSGENQKTSSKTDVSKTSVPNAGKGPGSNTSKPSLSTSRRDTGRFVSAVQEKDGIGDSRSVSKSRERDDRLSTSKDDESNKSSAKRSPKPSKSAEPKESLEDQEMFPFNMDEFVTVDEIVEESVEEDVSEKPEEAGKSPSKIAETVSNESSKDIAPKDANSKKRESSTASKQDHSFVTLDEVGEEDAFAAQPESSPEDIKQHQIPIIEHKKNRHTGKAHPSVMALDEVSDEEDFVEGKAVCKAQRIATGSKEKRGGLSLGRVKAVDETKASKASNDGACTIHEEARTGVKAGESKMDIDDQVLVTVDEFNEDDEDFMHNLFSEEHQFVTVDEIGDEDEEDDKPHDEIKAAHKSETVNSTKSTSEKGEKKKPEGLTSQTPVKPNTRSSTSGKPKDSSVKSTIIKRSLRSESKSPTATPKKRQQVEAMQQSNLNTAATDQKTVKDASKDEVESKRRKLDLPAKMLPYDPKIAVGLEFLIPKTGYFCELCSLFYMDDSSKIKHCKTLRHYNCVEKHMAQQQELHRTGDSSSEVQEEL
ncbi:zinc finger protein 638 [Pleurodeles waltl]|uniref:zinc finger protein 638 n=1 Tax=Pleurodeles waltl TaxID=8319 RepID=UPI0037099A6A